MEIPKNLNPHLVKTINALQGNVQLCNMTVNLDDKTQIPLNQYLSGIIEIGEAINYFKGDPIFNIWEALPLLLTDYQEIIGTSQEEAHKLLKRFNAYTWDEHKPELRKNYMQVLKESLWVADKKFGGWSLEYTGTPNLSTTLNTIIESPDFAQLQYTPALIQRIKKISEIEKEIEEIPSENIFNILYPKGWKKMSERNRIITKLETSLKQEAQNAIKPLTELGNEYRHLHVKEYYPDMI